jgi:hypothetical protein
VFGRHSWESPRILGNGDNVVALQTAKSTISYRDVAGWRSDFSCAPSSNPPAACERKVTPPTGWKLAVLLWRCYAAPELAGGMTCLRTLPPGPRKRGKLANSTFSATQILASVDSSVWTRVCQPWQTHLAMWQSHFWRRMKPWWLGFLLLHAACWKLVSHTCIVLPTAKMRLARISVDGDWLGVFSSGT